jgi:putative transposase
MGDSLFLTFRYRIKGQSSVRRLNLLAPESNLVWNYCNEMSFKAIRERSQWLSKTDLQKLTKGASEELNINSQTVQAILHDYVNKRVKAKKRKLRWRVSKKGPKRSSGWVPFNGQTAKVTGNKIRYNGQEFKFWDSWDGKNAKQRKFEGEIKTGCFSQDAQGYWYLNLVSEVSVIDTQHSVEEIGIDPGLKDTATLSDGVKIENGRHFATHEAKLGNFQRNHKRKQARKLASKIKRIRLDFLHKKTLELVKKYQTFFVGNVSGKFLQSGGKGKSSQDASVGIFRSILSYKAVRHQGRVIEVSEFASTVTCSNCFERSGPSGLSDLGIREWICSNCLSCHERDTNAALNILRVGRDSLRAAKAA